MVNQRTSKKTNAKSKENEINKNRPIKHSAPRVESGAIDSFLILIPILMLTTSLFTLFRFGLNQNELSSSATFIGRQISRQPNIGNLTEVTESIISKENFRVASFQVMRYPIGSQLFIELILVGEPIHAGWSTLVPSVRSISLVDEW